ncbi:9790_t:CDS:2, partial [Gigaspora margarita]
MGIRHVDARRNDRKGSKCGSKGDPVFDENILEEDCVIKDNEKDNVIDKKKNRVINKLNEMKSIQAKGVNSKNLPMKSVNQDDTFEFNDNGIEAADSKANDPKNGIRHQYGINIRKDKVKTFIDYQKSSAIAN